MPGNGGTRRAADHPGRRDGASRGCGVAHRASARPGRRLPWPIRRMPGGHRVSQADDKRTERTMEDRAPREDGRLYDHEDRGDIRGGSGDRRRGPIADWGGDELFGSRPARRSRPGAPSQAAPPTRAMASRRTPPPPGHASRTPPRHPHAHPAGPGRGVAPRWRSASRGTRRPARRRAGVRAGRPRGVGAGFARAPHRRHRRARRPPRSRRAVPDHLGARPDHAAAWAVGLGLLLILVAILTAGI